MRNLARREVLKAGFATVVTATLSPLLTKAKSKTEGNDVRKPELVHESAEEICFMEATTLVALLRAKKISSVEVMKAHLSQITRVNSTVNAIVTLVEAEQLLAEARAADAALAKGHWLGPLHGLPIGVKDLHATEGIRTTYGSPLYKGDIPQADCLLVEREKKAGGIVIGKDERTGIRPRVANVQSCVWSDAESARPRKDMRGKYGGRRGGSGLWHGAAGRWERLWRIAAESPKFLRGGGTATLAGTSAEYSGGPGVAAVFSCRRRGA